MTSWLRDRRRCDVTAFDRLARLYDLAMPAADPDVLARGLAYADGDLDRVLDVGGGTGRAARVLGEAVRRSEATRRPGRSGSSPPETDQTTRRAEPRPFVVDAARGMLRTASAAGVEGVQGDAGTLPVYDGAVDAVVIVDALHHFPTADREIAEAARVLRPGGALVIREFDPTTLRGRALSALERAVGFDSTFYAATDLLDLVEDAGLASFLPDRGFDYTVVGVKRGD